MSEPEESLSNVHQQLSFLHGLSAQPTYVLSFDGTRICRDMSAWMSELSADTPATYTNAQPTADKEDKQPSHNGPKSTRYSAPRIFRFSCNHYASSAGLHTDTLTLGRSILEIYSGPPIQSPATATALTKDCSWLEASLPAQRPGSRQ